MTELSKELEEYIRLRNTTDPIEAFNIFIKRNCPDLYAHFIDTDDNEAEFVRRAINSQLLSFIKRIEDEVINANRHDVVEYEGKDSH